MRRAPRRVAVALALPCCAAVLFLALLACPPRAASREIAWDGRTYLPIAVRPGADTRLVMPEEFDDAWERDSEVAVAPLDATTLIIRPRAATIDQRLTLRGRRSGTIYLARVSTSLPFTPLVVVRNPATSAEPALPDPAASVVDVLRALLRGVPPPGFRVDRSATILLDQPPYRLRARELWRSGRLAGIVADLESTVPGHAIQVVPANIVLRVPELGSLRAAAPDRFELDPTSPSTRLLLVFAR